MGLGERDQAGQALTVPVAAVQRPLRGGRVVPVVCAVARLGDERGQAVVLAAGDPVVVLRAAVRERVHAAVHVSADHVHAVVAGIHVLRSQRVAVVRHTRVPHDLDAHSRGRSGLVQHAVDVPERHDPV